MKSFAVFALLANVSAIQVDAEAQYGTCDAPVAKHMAYLFANHWSEYNNAPYGTMWKDPVFTPDNALFIPTDAYLGGKDSNNTDVVNDYRTKVVKWMRPKDIDTEKSPSLWGSGGPQPAGINQGALGDCWLMASMGAVAEFPDRVKAIFTDKYYSNEGIFRVNLHLKGEKIGFDVDDRLAMHCDKEKAGCSLQPMNSRPSKNGAWWVPILEKAYAKFTGTYVHLNGGHSI